MQSPPPKTCRKHRAPYPDNAVAEKWPRPGRWRLLSRPRLNAAWLVLTTAFFTPVACSAEAEPVDLKTQGRLLWPAGVMPWTATLAGHRLVVLDESGGVQVVDVSRPETPVASSRWLAGDVPIDLAAMDHRAYVAGVTGGVRFLEIDVPPFAAPRELGRYMPGGRVSALSVTGAERVLVASRIGSDEANESVIDLVDTTIPATPVRLGRIALPFEPAVRSLHWLGERVYIEADALYAFDLTDPARPVRETLTVFESYSGLSRFRVRLHGSEAFVLGHARFSGSLGIYSLPRGVAPLVRHGGWPTRGNAIDFAVAGSFLAIADQPFSFEAPTRPVIDVVQWFPYANPILVGTQTLDAVHGTPRFIRFRDRNLYLGTTEGLLILAIVPQPRFLAAERTSGGLRLRWNDAAAGFKLEHSPSLAPASWRQIAGAETTNTISVPTTAEAGYFRLSTP